MVQKVTDNIYTFRVDLPENPLRWLNSYAIVGRAGERSLLIDTGFGRPECSEPLLAGMEELNLSPENTDVLLTHLHSDHSGNAALLNRLGYRIFIGEVDGEILREETRPERRERREGMPEEVFHLAMDKNPAILYAPGPFEFECLADGQEISYGGHTLECVLTPGHTPGHMCFYERKNERMFLGDHVLFDITPNITAWPELPDALGSYIESLRKIMKYKVSLPLPAHRTTGGQPMAGRAAAIIEHHKIRLSETLEIVRRNPGITAYDTAGLTTWHIRARNWAEFPPAQKTFAVGETLSHLDCLRLRDKLSREEDGEGIYRYFVR